MIETDVEVDFAPPKDYVEPAAVSKETPPKNTASPELLGGLNDGDEDDSDSDSDNQFVSQSK